MVLYINICEEHFVYSSWFQSNRINYSSLNIIWRPNFKYSTRTADARWVHSLWCCAQTLCAARGSVFEAGDVRQPVKSGNCPSTVRHPQRKIVHEPRSSLCTQNWKWHVIFYMRYLTKSHVTVVFYTKSHLGQKKNPFYIKWTVLVEVSIKAVNNSA